MTSKNYGWQKRWQLDLAANTATHESRIVVQFTPGPGGQVQAAMTDPEGVTPALLAHHGGHNLPLRLARLTREALQMRAAALEKAARHG